MDSTEPILRDCAEPGQDGSPPMSVQQRRFASAGLSKLKLYRDLTVGNQGWLFLLGFEIYTTLLSGLGGFAGIGLRSAFLPLFLQRCAKAPVAGRGVTIRQPGRISVGRSVVIDDYAVLDIRSSDNAAQPAIEIGDHVLIGRASIISARGGTIKLGNACNISSHCRIATHSSIEVGESVLIAAYAYIGCGNHRFQDAAQPIIEQEMEIRGGVKIGANSWIGARATILDGVRIGENAVIGAHSLVREDVPDNAIVAGTPARLIRMRS